MFDINYRINSANWLLQLVCINTKTLSTLLLLSSVLFLLLLKLKYNFMGCRISNKRELQLVAYAIRVIQDSGGAIKPLRTSSTVFPIIFLNTKRLK